MPVLSWKRVKTPLSNPAIRGMTLIWHSEKIEIIDKIASCDGIKAAIGIINVNEKSRFSTRGKLYYISSPVLLSEFLPLADFLLIGKKTNHVPGF